MIAALRIFVMKGGDLFKLQNTLGRADQKMTQRYAHLAPEAFSDLHGIFGEHEESGEVVKMKGKRKSKAK